MAHWFREHVARVIFRPISDENTINADKYFSVAQVSGFKRRSVNNVLLQVRVLGLIFRLLQVKQELFGAEWRTATVNFRFQ